MISPKSLYILALRSFIKFGSFSTSDFICLPVCIKEDILNAMLLRGILCENWENLLHPRIKKLDFSGNQLTGIDILNVSKCGQLKVLEMNASKYLIFCYPSNVLECLFSQLPNLVKVSIQRNRGVTDYVVSVLTTQCPKLRELDVSGCPSLTAQVGSYLSKLSELRALNLSSTDVSDLTLACLSQGNSCDCFVELRINNCVRISNAGIQAVLKSFRHLTVLLLSGCPLVSVECQLEIDSTLNKGCKKKKVITWSLYL